MIMMDFNVDVEKAVTHQSIMQHTNKIWCKNHLIISVMLASPCH